MKALELASFPGMAERVSALYNEEQDALLLAMLGQEYIVRHEGFSFTGRRRRNTIGRDPRLSLLVRHRAAVMPWRSLGDFSGARARNSGRKWKCRSRSMPRKSSPAQIPSCRCSMRSSSEPDRQRYGDHGPGPAEGLSARGAVPGDPGFSRRGLGPVLEQCP